MKFLAALFLACLAAVTPARAQTWPTRPVTLVVPFAVGGGIDVTGRLVGARLAAELGQPVVVENVAGAFGTLGTQRVARAPADGHTLLFVVSSPINVAPLVTPSAVRYDGLKDFVPLATVGMLPFAVVGRNDLQADSMAALLRLAKAQPGRLTFGTDGTGSLLHITGEYLQQRAGVALVHVPYKAAPQALTDVAGGTLDLAILPVALVQPFVRDGRVRAFAVTSPARLASLPQVPTLAETAGFSDVALESWMGLLAPRGLPAPIAERLIGAMRQVTADKAVTTQLEERGITPRLVSGEAFAGLVARERGQIAQIVSGMHLQPE